MHPNEQVVLPLPPSLAAQINAAHERAQGAVRDALGHAAEAGRLLIDAKRQLPHGQFGAWMAEHCAFARTTASLYMRVARQWPELQGALRSGNALPLREAQRLLAAPSAPARDLGEDALPQQVINAVAELDRLEATLGEDIGAELNERIEAAGPDLMDKLRRAVWFARHVPSELAVYRRWQAARVHLDTLGERLVLQLAAWFGVPPDEIRCASVEEIERWQGLAKQRLRELETAELAQREQGGARAPQA